MIRRQLLFISLLLCLQLSLLPISKIFFLLLIYDCLTIMYLGGDFFVYTPLRACCAFLMSLNNSEKFSLYLQYFFHSFSLSYPGTPITHMVDLRHSIPLFSMLGIFLSVCFIWDIFYWPIFKFLNSFLCSGNCQ